MKVPMTLEGSERLREELTHLKSVLRPQIIKAIATAREHGDLKENAEYHAAKEQQSFAEGRIKEIEGKLADAQVIDVTKIKTHRQGGLRLDGDAGRRSRAARRSATRSSAKTRRT